MMGVIRSHLHNQFHSIRATSYQGDSIEGLKSNDTSNSSCNYINHPTAHPANYFMLKLGASDAHCRASCEPLPGTDPAEQGTAYILL